jgi:hypothetical protein
MKYLTLALATAAFIFVGAQDVQANKLINNKASGSINGEVNVNFNKKKQSSTIDVGSVKALSVMGSSTLEGNEANGSIDGDVNINFNKKKQESHIAVGSVSSYQFEGGE